MHRLGGLVLAAAGLATAASVALAAQSPRQLRAAIFRAARTKHSVHYVTHSVLKLRRLEIVGDVSGNRGIQRITFVSGGNAGHVTIRVVRRTAYLRGDAFTLHSYMGFTTSQASRYHGKWISIPHARKGYSNVAAAVTLPSFLSDLYPRGRRLVRVSGKVDGEKVVGVRVAGVKRGLHVVTTLYARAHGMPLPLKEHEVAAGSGYESSVTIGRWNEPVHVRAPAHAIPISKVVAS